MDRYTVAEEAFKNGYTKGYSDAMEAKYASTLSPGRFKTTKQGAKLKVLMDGAKHHSDIPKAIADKLLMELVWHNCKTCPPEELFNKCLFITNGTNFMQARWDRDVGYIGDNCMIEPIKDNAEQWWWADIVQTTTKFFRELKTTMEEAK